jgi:UDP-N-acetylglucosamine--N-acetylmuramyl-(pentapeptide) pyrophosphoryl-undecaprenol N-acetylglucosamine transferase
VSQDNPPYRIIISGGGTGGHIYPAIAIANALRSMRPDTKILFVGAQGRMEMQKVPEAGYRIEGLWISGLQRQLTTDNLAFPLKVASSVIKSFRILAKFRPDVAVGVGGFASGPLLYAASLKKIPALLQEQNSYAGLTNKMLANQVQKICVAHHGMERFFPKEKLVFTGNPIRHDIVTLAAEGVDRRRAEGLEYFGLSADKPTLLVVGGSLGARTLNESVLAGIEKLTAQNVQVIWQSGKTAYPAMSARLVAVEHRPGIQLREFLMRMDLAYAVADVVVSRAGALAISELALVRKPVIFVPSPNVAEDHQRKNAEALVKEDAALMVLDADAPRQLIDQAIALLNDPARQQVLRQNIGQLARPEAAQQIAEEVLSLVKTKKLKTAE